MGSHGRERRAGTAGVLIAAVLWGTTGTAATFAPEVGAVAIGAMAMSGGGLLQALAAGRDIRRAGPLLGYHWRCLIAGAVAVACYPLAFYAAMRLAGVTIGTVVSIGSAPLLSALIEYRLDGGRRPGGRWAVGAGLGLLGMGLLCLAETGFHDSADDSSPGDTWRVVQGVALGLLAGFTYAFFSWSARRLMQSGTPPRTAMGATFGLGGLLLLPVLLVTGAPLLGSLQNAAVGLYMALVPMFLGYLGYGYGLARVPASTATTLTLLEPVVAALLAVAVVGERLPPLGWLGVALVVACLVWLVVLSERIESRGGRQT